MSRAATDWAWKLDVKPASLKLQLLSMADRADEEHCCFPSIARLVRDTSLDKKTIQKGFGDLQALGVICDTGERKGATRRVKVWQLRLEHDRFGNGPKNGNIPENGYVNDPKNGCLNDPENGIQNQSYNHITTLPALPDGRAPVWPTPQPGFVSTAAQRRLGIAPGQGIPMPVHFAPTEKHTRLASERGVDLATEFEKFRDYCQSTGKTYLDWGAALALWLRNARPDNRKPAITGRSGGLDMDNTDWAEDLKL